MNSCLKLTLAIFFLVAVPNSPAVAKDDTTSLEDEIQTLKEGQQQIQKDLAEIKKLLKDGARAAPGQQAFKPTDMQLGNVPTMGENDAVVTLIEFSDYQCPFCKRHATTVMNELMESYIDTGKVRFVMREFPIPNLHARAEAASTAALCAGDQDNYWGMHDALFEDQKANTDEAFHEMAASLELDTTAFDECMSSGKFDEQISADQLAAQKLGITGTPSFVLGLTDPDDPSKVHLTRYIRGAQPFPTFSAAIDEILDSLESD